MYTKDHVIILVKDHLRDHLGAACKCKPEVATSKASSPTNDSLPKVPSGEWGMNTFLLKLADELTTEDLKKMKYLLTENGFEYIKFHIARKEKMDRKKLEELRYLVSHATCVPLEFVFASGIEATDSILVTFMIPEGYGYVLSDLDDKEKDFLGSRGVDAIWYNGQLISCIAEGVVNVDIKLQADLMNKILQTWEQNLNAKEKHALMKKFLPKAKDQKAYHESKLLLLQFLWKKHKESDNETHIQAWVDLVLSEIKRMDLYQEWTKNSEILIQAFIGNSSQKQICERKRKKKEQKRDEGWSESATIVPQNSHSLRPVWNNQHKSQDERLQHIGEMLERLSTYILEPNVSPGKRDTLLDLSQPLLSQFFA